MVIPFLLLALRRFRKLTRVPVIQWSAAFVFFCGLTHLMGAVEFYLPLYRVDTLLKVGTVAATWGTIIMAFSFVRRVQALLGKDPAEGDNRPTAPGSSGQRYASLDELVKLDNEQEKEVQRLRQRSDKLLATALLQLEKLTEKVES